MKLNIKKNRPASQNERQADPAHVEHVDGKEE